MSELSGCLGDGVCTDPRCSRHGLGGELERAQVREIAAWLRHIDRLDEIPGAKWPGLKFNPLWDAANAIEREFGGRS